MCILCVVPISHVLSTCERNAKRLEPTRASHTCIVTCELLCVTCGAHDIHMCLPYLACVSHAKNLHHMWANVWNWNNTCGTHVNTCDSRVGHMWIKCDFSVGVDHPEQPIAKPTNPTTITQPGLFPAFALSCQFNKNGSKSEIISLFSMFNMSVL